MRKTTLLFLSLFFLAEFQLYADSKIDSKLQAVLQSASGPVEVVVTFWGEGAPTGSQIQLIKDVGITRGITFHTLPIAGVLATKQQVEVLAESPEVRSLYYNAKLEYYNADATALTGVDRARSDKNITARNGGMPISGNGIGVMINDSGIDATHGDLEFLDHVVQNVLGTTNLNAYSSLLPVTYVENQPNTDTNSGHGTHVAGIAGGTGQKSDGKYEGVAPGADLIGYGSGAVLFILDAVGGFDYALTHQHEYGIRVINNSWGSSGDFDPDDPVNVATKDAYDRNIIVVFSAGNSGPGSDTHNPYAKAPWVISAGAGNDAGELADFSSRGSNKGATFMVDGETWTWKDQPTIVAPGVNIISARTASPVGVLSTDSDAEEIETAFLPFYTQLSGTSMSAPHVAGIVALMLEVNPALAPLEVKSILQQTATNMDGREAFEVGAGYVNAYAAVQTALDPSTPYGSTVNKDRDFNSSVNLSTAEQDFTVQYDPVLTTSNSFDFVVPQNTNIVEARIAAEGLMDFTGNTLNLVLIAPDGTEFSSGINVLFPIFFDRVVRISNPPSGDWILEVRGLRGVTENPTDGAALPEEVNGSVNLISIKGFTGLNDIEGHPARDAIILAVSERLVDGYPNGKYRPDQNIKRIEVGDYLMMGRKVRQHLPTDGSSTFGDLNGDLDQLIGESVTARGAALRDTFQVDRGVMLTETSGQFNPYLNVSRAELAYSLVQSLGLEDQALARNSQAVTVAYKGERIPIEDQEEIPGQLRGYVQLALDLNLMNAKFSLSQGEFDLEPTVSAEFNPGSSVTRGEYAVSVTRTQSANTNALAGNQQKTARQNLFQEQQPTYPLKLNQNYPNPFNPGTAISYSVPNQSQVSLIVYNLLGRKVATLVNSTKRAGQYHVNFDASQLASGVYLYRLKVGTEVITKKMNLIK